MREGGTAPSWTPFRRDGKLGTHAFPRKPPARSRGKGLTPRPQDERRSIVSADPHSERISLAQLRGFP